MIVLVLGVLVQLISLGLTGPCDECRLELARRLWLNTDSVSKSLTITDIWSRYSAALNGFWKCETTSECSDIDNVIFGLQDPFFGQVIAEAVDENAFCVSSALAYSAVECSLKHEDSILNVIAANQDPACDIVIALLEEFACRHAIYAEKCGSDSAADSLFQLARLLAEKVLIKACDEGHCLPTHSACQGLTRSADPFSADKNPNTIVFEGGTENVGLIPKPQQTLLETEDPASKLSSRDILLNAESKYYCADTIGICQPCSDFDCIRFADKTFDSAGECIRQSECMSVFAKF